MAAVVFFTFAFLIYSVNSQIIGLGPTFPNSRGFETTVPCTNEVYKPSGPVGVDPCGNIQAIPNLISASQPVLNVMSLNQPCSNVPPSNVLNLAAPSFIQNQAPCNQPVINTPTQPIVSNVITKFPNVQATPSCNVCSNLQYTNTAQTTPSVIGNTATPVVTVIDNTLANSLANALQLLILSNILENSGTCNTAQNLPCINNYEVVTPDLTLPALSCEYISNVNYPESVVSIQEPAFTCTEPVCSCPEQGYTCTEQVISCPEPVIYQAYPANFGGYSVIDNSGFQCGQNQVCFENSQYQVGPVCQERAPMPPVATLPPMALEVPFPSSIPAQLTCNLGILPSNQPCVTFNVEPLPCNNVFGSFGNFI